MPRLKKRADGRYHKNVYIGTDPETKKKKYKSVYGTSLAEVEAKEREIKTQIGKGIDVSAPVETFEVWRRRWLKAKRASVCQKTLETLEDCTAAMNESIGHIPITKIRLVDIQAVIDSLSDKGRAKTTLQKVRNYTEQIFRLAIKNRIMDYNPASDAEVPSNAHKEKRTALNDEQQRWVREMPHRAQTPAMIMMYAGLRRGEVIPLCWSDIDLDGRTISVNKSVEMINGSSCLKTGAKTKAGTRIIDIPQALVDYLRPLCPEATGKVTPLNQLVCPAARGGMMSDSSWRRMWSSYMQDLNIKYGYNGQRNKFDPKRNGDKPIIMLIEPFTAHQLRHTFATLLYLAGVDPMTAMQQLGHADIKTTLGIYTHLDAKYKRRSMDKLDEYLAKAE